MMNKYKYSDDSSYCLGMSLTIEALKHQAKYIIEIYLSTKAHKNKQLDYLLQLCSENNIIYKYDDNLIDKLSIKGNCYCIGVFNKFYHQLVSNKHVILYEFDDFGELGTIIRSAVSFDFKDIVLINSDIDYFDPRCVRASVGAIFHTNIEKYNSIDEYLNKYHKQKLISFVSNSDKELNDLILSDNYSLVISQDYYGLDQYKDNAYYLAHNNLDEISLSIRSSIILNYAYNQNLKR